MRLFKYHARATGSRSKTTPTIGLLLLAIVGFSLAFAGSARSATTINLGAAASFGALSFTAMTNADAAGPTVVSGDVEDEMKTLRSCKKTVQKVRRI